ncbi:MAG: ADP-ribosylglycohydrolase family protein, partial [Acidimicrobiia bacterium]
MTSDKATEKGSGKAGRFAANGSDVPGPRTAASNPNDPLFSLSIDDGAGALLAAAAGDVAGGADPTSYSAITQAATVLAYHLLTHGSVDRDVLARGLVELAGGEDGRFTYRAPSAAFDDWLKSSLRGSPTVSSMGSSEPAARSVPIGVFHRRDPGLLVSSVVNASRMTHLDASTAVAAAAVAGAVAGSCFVQAGADLVFGAAETAEQALRLIEDEPYRFGDVTTASEVPARLRSLVSVVAGEPDAIAAAVTAGRTVDGVDGAILGIVLGANKLVDPIKLIEVAANAGGSEAGAVTGGIVGARSGLIRWPWRVHNDTWFAELGRRLVSRHAEVRDLPIPYAVEERMLMAARTRAS